MKSKESEIRTSKSRKIYFSRKTKQETNNNKNEEKLWKKTEKGKFRNRRKCKDVGMVDGNIIRKWNKPSKQYFGNWWTNKNKCIFNVEMSIRFMAFGFFSRVKIAQWFLVSRNYCYQLESLNEPQYNLYHQRFHVSTSFPCKIIAHKHVSTLEPSDSHLTSHAIRNNSEHARDDQKHSTSRETTASRLNSEKSSTWPKSSRIPLQVSHSSRGSKPRAHILHIFFNIKREKIGI